MLRFISHLTSVSSAALLCVLNLYLWKEGSLLNPANTYPPFLFFTCSETLLSIAKFNFGCNVHSHIYVFPYLVSTDARVPKFVDQGLVPIHHAAGVCFNYKIKQNAECPCRTILPDWFRLWKLVWRTRCTGRSQRTRILLRVPSSHTDVT